MYACFFSGPWCTTAALFLADEARYRGTSRIKNSPPPRPLGPTRLGTGVPRS